MSTLRRAAGLESSPTITATKGKTEREDGESPPQSSMTGEGVVTHGGDNEQHSQEASNKGSNLEHDDNSSGHIKTQRDEDETKDQGKSGLISDKVVETTRSQEGTGKAPATNHHVQSTDISSSVTQHTMDIAATTSAPRSTKFGGGLLSMIARTSTKGNTDGGRMPGDDGQVRGSKVSKIFTVAGRTRREEVRRRMELHEVFPMAAEWGGLTLATLLNHGVLEKRENIKAISAEATASALLRQTLEVPLSFFF